MLTQKTSLVESPKAGEKPPVLVVDDEYGPRESIAFTLGTEFEVDTAERAAEALAKIKQTQYAVVVMDIRMPEMDGIRALDELRKIDPLVSVVMLTGYGTLLTAQQAMVAGANQYLRKPPDVAELLAAVRQQAQNSRVRRHQAKLAQDAVDQYLNSTGALSIKAAVEADVTLGGAAYTSRVTGWSDYGTIVIGGTEYMGARLSVEAWPV
jgi:DNA-binding NtrC family response regulator